MSITETVSTKDRILEAAEKLFAEQGFGACSRFPGEAVAWASYLSVAVGAI